MDPTLSTTATGGTSSTGSSASYNITTGVIAGDSLLVVGTTVQANFASLQNVSSVTINGVSMTNITRVSQDNGGGYGSRTEMWVLQGTSIPASGTYSIAITMAGSVEAIASGAMLFTSIVPIASNASATNSANGTNPLSVTISPTKGNTLLISTWGSQNASSVSVGSGETKAYESRPADACTNIGSYKIARASGSNTMSAGFVNPESEEIIAVAYAISPSGGSFVFNLI